MFLLSGIEVYICIFSFAYPLKNVSFWTDPLVVAFDVVTTALAMCGTLPTKDIGLEVGPFFGRFQNSKSRFHQDFVKIGIRQLCHDSNTGVLEPHPESRFAGWRRLEWNSVCLSIPGDL